MATKATVLKDKDGTSLYPVTDVSLVVGLQEGAIMESVVVSELPTADATTVGKIYMIPSATVTGEFDRYMTTYSNSAYIWTQLGSTAIPSPVIADNLTTNDATQALSAKQGKVLNDNMTQLGQELNGRMNGLDIDIFGKVEENLTLSGSWTESNKWLLLKGGVAYSIKAISANAGSTYVSVRVDRADNSGVKLITIGAEETTASAIFTPAADEVARVRIYTTSYLARGSVNVSFEVSGSLKDYVDGRDTQIGEQIELLDQKVVSDITQLQSEISGTVFDNNVTIVNYENVAATFNMVSGKTYTFMLDKESFAGSVYFGLMDKDGNYIRNYTSVTSMPFTYQYTPEQDYPMAKCMLGKGGTNIFSLKITENGSISERFDEVGNDIAVNNADIVNLESEFKEFKLTDIERKVSYTQSSTHLELDAATQTIKTSDNNSRYALYRYFDEDAAVRVTGTLSNASKTLYICKTAQLPANNVAADDVIAINSATFDEIVQVQSGDYLCLLVNFTYNSGFSMSVVEQLKPLVLFNAKNSAPVIQYDGKIVDINYCSVPYSMYPGNTYGNFLASIQAGFGGLKADMRLTSDNEIVLCHDSGYKLNSDGDIIPYNSAEYASSVEIHDKTFAEITALKFAEQVGGQDIHPCSLDDMLYLCKRYKSIPYLTLRNESWSSDTIDRMYYLLQKYGLVSKVIINLFPVDETLCSLLLGKDKSLIICATSDSKHLDRSSIDDAYNLGCQIACFRRDNGVGHVDLLIDQLTPEIIQYAASKGIRLWAWNNTTAASIEEHIKAGIVGFQNYSFTPIDDIG